MKKGISILGAMVIFLLAGCSSMDEKLGDYYVERSGIKEDEDYSVYVELEEDGKLDEEGVYTEANLILSEETTEERKAQVYVTFAENANVRITYYLDAKKEEPVSGGCYLNPGDSLYASIENYDYTKTSMYSFEAFRIYEFTDGKMSELSWNSDLDDCVFTIPDDYTGTELSVIPIGKYEDRKLVLKDLYTDSKGKEVSLSGTWTVNDEQTTDDEISINSVEPYLVSYEYDTNQYFFVKASPTVRYQGDGVVIFDEYEANSKEGTFSVEIHPYISVTLKADQEWRYESKNNEAKKIKAGASETIEGKKYDDKIVVTTSKMANWEYDSKYISESENNPEQYNGGYKYTFTVVDSNAQFCLDPEEYKYEHGTIVFKCGNETIEEKTYLSQGKTISYEASSVEDGYWLPAGDHIITIGTDEEATKEQIKAISFSPKIERTVTFEQPAYGGVVQYYCDGEEIKTTNAKIYEGSIISIKHKCWEGWIWNGDENPEYKVQGKKNQTCTIGDLDIEKLFSEDDDHKPELEIVLDESLGETMNISISTSSVERQLQYEDERFKSSKTTDIGKIGSEQGITVSLKNDSVKSGTAVKISYILRKNGSKEVIEQTEYITDIPATVNFDIYRKSEIATSKEYYSKARLDIRVVNVTKYQGQSVENGTLTLKYADTNTEVKKGDLVDNDRDVNVSIKPSTGYYVSGKNVSNDFYQDTMTFEKFLKDVDKIIAKHEIKKIYSVTLDTKDSYGTVTYTINGTSVEGKVSVREGQKIKISYKITDSNYKFKASNKFSEFFSKMKAKTEDSRTIEINEEFNGKTISRDDYFEIEKR